MGIRGENVLAADVEAAPAVAGVGGQRGSGEEEEAVPGMS